MNKTQTMISLCCVLSIISGCDANADFGHNTARSNTDKGGTTPPEPNSPTPNPLRTAYFGDLHIHTCYSFDAFIDGNQETDPRSAYRFARGDSITLGNGEEMKLSVPLDFAAVTDHAELLADYTLCTEPDSPIFNSDYCTASRSSDLAAFDVIVESLTQRPARVVPALRDPTLDIDAAARSPWDRIVMAAEDLNLPGEFTTFIAFEFSPMLDDVGMLHRNVIFRNREVPDRVLGAQDLQSPEGLWTWLDSVCRVDCEALAIPHNSNFSWGIAFQPMNSDGSGFTSEILTQRAAREPLVEVFQHKGNSECMQGVGMTDEECGFEQVFPECDEERKTQCVDYGSTVRNGLKTGLKLEREFGVNPFKYGIVASTDTHSSTPGATGESRFSGQNANRDDTPEERLTTGSMALRYNGGGLAGVWAEENTRDSLFAALKRKEVFGTSGTRIRVRFFGGWNYPADLLLADDWINTAYQDGVPMGGDLSIRSKLHKPKFLIWAVKDPNSANLDRIQVIKGWLDGEEERERVYDVVCADGRIANIDTGRCVPTKTNVDLNDCSYSSNHGDAVLNTVWTDLDFDPNQPAFYYLRVFENPTCRWSTWDSLRLGIDPPQSVPATVQERAWSSPIWYSP